MSCNHLLAENKRARVEPFGPRIGRHDLYLPPGYVLKTWRDDQGELHGEVECDQTAFFLSAWLRCLMFNLMTRFAQAMGGEYNIKMRDSTCA